MPPEQAGQVTDLEWQFSGNAITKNYLMMLDLLAHNNWERPVYYVSTTGREAYIGLDNYLQLEGFAYRLVPVRQVITRNEIGGVNTDVMFDNLMNKFEFDIIKPGFLISDDVYRMTITMRNSLFQAGRCIGGRKQDWTWQYRYATGYRRLFRTSIVPYNYFNLSIAEAYLKAGQTEKGNEILQQDDRHPGVSSWNISSGSRQNKQAYISNGYPARPWLCCMPSGQVAEENGQKEIADKADGNPGYLL